MVTKDTIISDIFNNFPDKASFLAAKLKDYKLLCGGCSAATWETLETGMAKHGFTDKLDDLIKDLNKVINTDYDRTTVTLTPKAAEKFKAILKEEKKEGCALRIAEKAGGCSGVRYMLDFSNAAKVDDIILKSKGVDIHVDKELSRLLGIVIDYVDGLNGAGFKIINPNARSSCKCGDSHSY